MMHKKKKNLHLFKNRTVLSVGDAPPNPRSYVSHDAISVITVSGLFTSLA